jgi:hypothetical protein
MVKRIIRAFGAASGDDPGGEDIAKLAGVQRTVVSTCSKFLRGSGIVQPDKNKLTEVGNQLSMAWSMENQPLAEEALQRIIMSAPALAQLVNTVRARGLMDLILLRGQIIVAAGLNENSFLIPYAKTIVDMLEDSRLVQVADDVVTPARAATVGRSNVLPDAERNGGTKEEKLETPSKESSAEESENGKSDKPIRTPIPLGPKRLAYVELPANWDNKELPKLLKMLELIFGGEVN